MHCHVCTECEIADLDIEAVRRLLTTSCIMLVMLMVIIVAALTIVDEQAVEQPIGDLARLVAIEVDGLERVDERTLPLDLLAHDDTILVVVFTRPPVAAREPFDAHES